jgi:hypothetical protein
VSWARLTVMLAKTISIGPLIRSNYCQVNALSSRTTPLCEDFLPKPSCVRRWRSERRVIPIPPSACARG